MGGSLQTIDFVVIGGYLVFAIAVGSLFSRRAGTSFESFFVGDRKLPWWIAGTSIVATTFAADTPLAVTGITALNGISGNWIWWCWGIAHLVSTFFFARLWRRSNVLTSAEITELRYSGRAAAGLRAFQAVYNGVFINCMTMAWVIAAMVKISRAFFDIEPAWIIAVCVTVSVTYTVLGGFRSVVVTDLVQFSLGMFGAILLAVLCVQVFGGIGTLPSEGDTGSGLLGELAEKVQEEGERTSSDVLGFIPSSDHPTLPPILFVTLLIAGWWRFAEGNGYIVQRLASCRDEAQAQAASLWFAIAHNALRPWPWILVALASLVFYPRLPDEVPSSLVAEVNSHGVEIAPTTLDIATGGRLEVRGLTQDCSVWVGETQATLERTGDGTAIADFGPFGRSGFESVRLDCSGTSVDVGHVRVHLTDREMGYPLMMRRLLPAGWLGLVVASLIAAFMSTIDTHTNWGSSYFVQDLYRRFIRTDASPKHYVLVSRISIVAMASLAGFAALFISDIATVWRFLINLGAGLGSVAAIRWFWPRVTAWAEIGAMITTTVLAIGFEIGSDLEPWQKIIWIAVGSMATWIPLSLFGPQNDAETLRRFAQRVRPPGRAWAPYRDTPGDSIAPMVQRFAGGAAIVFCSLFGIGDLLLGWRLRGAALLVLSLFLLLRVVASAANSAEESR